MSIVLKNTTFWIQPGNTPGRIPWWAAWQSIGEYVYNLFSARVLPGRAEGPAPSQSEH